MSVLCFVKKLIHFFVTIDKNGVTVRGVIGWIVLLVLALPLGAMDKIVVQLQWSHQFQFAGYYIARAKGYYRNAGLDVAIRPFRRGMSVEAEVLSGRAQFGVGRTSLLLAYADDQPVVAMAAIFQSSPMVLLVREDSAIDSLKDLIGKRVMLTHDQETAASIQAMLTSQGISADTMHLVPHTFDPYALEYNETDAMSAYVSHEPFLLSRHGVSTKALDPKRYGFNFYSDILFTTRDEISHFPERTRRFYDATLRGWKYAFEHIEETARLIEERYRPPHRLYEDLVNEGIILRSMAIRPGVALGNINLERLEAINQMYTLLGFSDSSKSLEPFLYHPKKLVFHAKEEEWLKAHRHIRVGVLRHFAPIEFVDKSGLHKGVTSGYLKAISDRLNVTFSVLKYESTRQIADALKAKTIDLAMTLPRTGTHNRNMLFTSAYLPLPSAVVAGETFSYIGDLAVLKNHKVAVIEKSAAASRLVSNYPKIVPVFEPTVQQALTKVAYGDADAAIGPLAVTSFIIANRGYNNLKIVGQTPYNNELPIAVRGDWPIFRDMIQKVLDSLDDEEKTHIYRTWVPTVFEHRVDYTIVWSILGVFGLLGLVFLYQYLRLDYLVKLKTVELQSLNDSLQERIDKVVSEIKTQERMMIQQSKMAMIGEMIESIAHQWRQPLNIIGLGISNYDFKRRLGTSDEKDLEQTMEMVHNQIGFMSQTIDDFRNFFKKDKQKQKIAMSVLIEDVMTLVAPMYRSKKIALEVEIAQDGEFVTYPNELKQVMLNLLNNARDAIVQREKEERSVLVMAAYDDERVFIKVEDTGGGIDASIIERIFDPYFTTKFESQGTGIGLYMSKTIIEKHLRGRLRVENSNKGARFIIDLPRMEIDQTDSAQG